MAKKVLIVDDEHDIVETLKFMIESSGYECFCAYNGEDGLNMAKEIVPDLIILDVMMPVMNGYKVSRLLKFDTRYKDIPIIMLTARSQEKDKELVKLVAIYKKRNITIQKVMFTNVIFLLVGKKMTTITGINAWAK